MSRSKPHSATSTYTLALLCFIILNLIVCTGGADIATSSSQTFQLARATNLFKLPITLFSQPIAPIFDTGTGRLIVFDETYCNSARGWNKHHLNAGCFNATAAGTTVESPTYSYSLFIDGENITAIVRRFKPVKAKIGPPSSNYPEFSLDNTGLLGYAESASRFYHGYSYWNDTSGSIGTGPVYLSTNFASGTVATTSTFWQLMWNANSTSFAFDFTDPDNATLITNPNLGHPDINWSDSSGLYAVDLYYMNIFHMKMCGVDLFSNYSSSIAAFPDTGTECLALPAEIFDGLMTWIPGNCSLEEVDKRLECVMNSSIYSSNSNSRLPVIEFTLSETKSESIYLPLSLLIEPEHTVSVGVDNVKVRFCIARRSAIWSRDFRISLGTYVFKAFAAVFDVPNGRIGVVQQHGYSSHANSNSSVCATPVACKHGFEYRALTNKCLPPECSNTIFQEYDPVSGRCRVNLGVFLGIVIVVGVIGLLDLSIEFWYSKLAAKALKDTRASRV